MTLGPSFAVALQLIPAKAVFLQSRVPLIISSFPPFWLCKRRQLPGRVRSMVVFAVVDIFFFLFESIFWPQCFHASNCRYICVYINNHLENQL